MAFENIVVYKGTDYHSAFPHIIRLQNGELVSIFRQAIARGGQADDEHNRTLTHSHVDADSRIALVRSTDDGATWDPGSLVVVDQSDGGSDLNMAMVSQLSSGELVAKNHRWFTDGTTQRSDRLSLDRSGREPSSVVFDSLYFMRSSDEGRTWGAPRPVEVESIAYRAHTGKSDIITMPDGTLLTTINGYGEASGVDRVYVVRSRDGGSTWAEPSLVLGDPNGRIGFGEPPVVHLASGRLLVVTRTSEAAGFLYQAHSDDGGWVWQGQRRTPIWGFPCHLLQLRSGTIVCAYGYRRAPYGIRAALSHDEGETWDIGREIVLRDDGLHRDLGYPASIQLEDDRILTIYYFHGEDGIRHIAGTIWSEEDTT